nr:prepilin-type N-terminal cleavage/methylation domain-containing protein [Bacilli bacterium]
MKEKGFTLIELLAVIVILAIIALIITPIISNVIDASRKAAFKESVNGIIDSGGSYLQEYILAHNDELNDFPVEFPCDGTKCGNDEFTLTFKGNVPKSGNIIIQRDGILAEYITDGKYCAYGYKWNLVVENSCGDVDVTNPTITGTQNGKVITLTMTDNESGIDSYCATNVDSTEGCNWVVPSNASSEEYEIAEAGTKYFFTKDKKGNISDSINFTTTSNDYCQYILNPIAGEYGYKGSVQSFTVPADCPGTYKLEVWGAQGGSSTQGGSGAYGGYSSGTVKLAAGTVLYIAVGGQGGAGGGGYNGGGSAFSISGGGGGATHIATTNRGTLSNYNSYRSEVLIVAGGGGGVGFWTDYGLQFLAGGAGGGTTGGNSTRGAQGGTQSSGYAFGQGGNGTCYGGGAGGGGGWYGGYGINCNDGGGGGGSGYIGGVTDGTTTAGQRAGHGGAKITFISFN